MWQFCHCWRLRRRRRRNRRKREQLAPAASETYTRVLLEETSTISTHFNSVGHFDFSRVRRKHFLAILFRMFGDIFPSSFLAFLSFLMRLRSFDDRHQKNFPTQSSSSCSSSVHTNMVLAAWLQTKMLSIFIKRFIWPKRRKNSIRIYRIHFEFHFPAFLLSFFGRRRAKSIFSFSFFFSRMTFGKRGGGPKIEWLAFASFFPSFQQSHVLTI